jgi:hypothetical protein
MSQSRLHPSQLPVVTVFEYVASQSMLDTHFGNVVLIANAGATTYTIPTNAVLPCDIGTTVVLGQAGDGTVTVDGAGVTFRTPETLSIRKLNGKITLMKTGTDRWDVEGNLTAA